MAAQGEGDGQAGQFFPLRPQLLLSSKVADGHVGADAAKVPNDSHALSRQAENYDAPARYLGNVKGGYRLLTA